MNPGTWLMTHNRGRGRRFDRSRPRLVLGVVFFVGLALFLFPIITDAINSQSMSYVVRAYDEQAARIPEHELERLRREAEAHNEALQGATPSIADPFPESPTAPAAVSHINLLELNQAIGHLEIPRIHVDLPIYEGTDDSALERGIGHIENSSLPVGGRGTHSILTGHRGLPTATMFRSLDQVLVGDTFFVHTLGRTLAYRVVETVIVLPTEFGRLRIEEGRDLVTLVTCEPYMINSHRLLVTGERVPYTPPEATTEPAFLTDAQMAWLLQWGPLLTAVTLVILAAILARGIWIRRRGVRR